MSDEQVRREFLAWASKTLLTEADGDPLELGFKLYQQGRATRQAEIDRLTAELAECKKDAERYRALRNFGTFAHVDSLLDSTDFNTLDSAIDFVMEKSA